MCEGPSRCKMSLDRRSMVRYSFSGPIPPKFEHKLRRHKQSFGKIATTVVLDEDDNNNNIVHFFTVFLTIKTLSQNITITLLQISLKLHEHRGCYWRKKFPSMIFEEQFPVPRDTAASKIGNNVISLLWQLRCRCNPDHKFSSLSNTTVVAIFPNLCLWWRSLCSNVGRMGPEKLYRASLMQYHSSRCHAMRIQHQYANLSRILLFWIALCHKFYYITWQNSS